MVRQRYEIHGQATSHVTGVSPTWNFKRIRTSTVCGMVCGKTLLRPRAGLLRRTCSSWLHPPRFDMTQSEIASLPQAVFPGRVVVVCSPEDEIVYRHDIDKIRNSRLLGMDVESLLHIGRSSFSCSTCLVQLTRRNLCVIWRVQRNLEKTDPRTGILWFSSVLKDILCNPLILKVRIFQYSC